MNTKQLIGAKIKELRKRKKITQEKLSEAVGINPRQMVRIEMGESFPTLENLEKIALVLGITVQDLFCNDSYEQRDILQQKITSKLNEFDDKTIKIIYSLVMNI